MSKLTICVDFDGVIHDYMQGWNGGQIYGKVVNGFFPWLLEAREHFAIVVYSSRSRTQEGIDAMQKFLLDQWLEWTKTYEGRNVEVPLAWEGTQGSATTFTMVTFAAVKPIAWLTIDDRALCFNGNWGDPNFSVKAMQAFKPWNQPVE